MRRSNGFFSKLTPTRKVVRKSGSKQDLRSSSEKVTLQRVLGLTTTNTNGLACSTTTGIIAYPAGCIIVLYNLKTNQQTHIPNPDKKTITCLAFSNDGKYLVSGESGQQPFVRVWELSESVTQVAELRGHKSGITSVEFSPNQKLLVSIGDQHDMLVNVWNWKLGNTVACNKSGCRVRAVSFSENGNYLVTVGNRHVKFWYLDSEASNKGNVPITPITGRSGILGDQRNNCFSDVMCGRGRSSLYTYCVTKSGLLCMFSEKRILDKWVELKAGCTNCLHVTEKYIFCGCSDGVVRVFEPINLKFIATLPQPHNLGVNVSDGVVPSDLLKSSNKNCPDLVAITVDEKHWKLSCIYNDHSLYIWDVHDVKKVGKAASFLYHSACIWGVEVYFGEHRETLPPGSFLTCSSDDTIRIWNLETGGQTNKAYPRNLYSKELLKVVYIDEGLSNLQDTSMAPFGKESETKNGVRCMQVSPNGQVLATGDRNGNLRIYDLQFFDELIRIEAHESEILCVEFCLPESGYDLLASSSRDRLIHIFDVKNDYSLLQTIDDHSSSITAVRFNYDLDMLQLLSCGADKVVMFHTAQMNDTGSVCFIRNTIVPGKSTLYDMVIEPTRKYAATVGQDRNLRIYDIQGAKQINCYKGSLGDEGNLIKLQLDQSGMYAAVSCSDKTLGIYDFGNGDCVSSMFGHSELVTGLKFTADGKHMISVSGDGCIFLWKLPTSFTENILNRMNDLNLPLPSNIPTDDISDVRRKTFVVKSTSQSPVSSSVNEFRDPKQVLENVPAKSPFGYRFSVGQLPLWAQKQIGVGDNNVENKGTSQPLGKWGERSESGLCTVPEISQDARRYSNSQDSTSSMSSEKSTVFEEQNSVEANVIYPPMNDNNSVDELGRTFHVTEVNRLQTSRPTKQSLFGDPDQNELASRRTNGAGSPVEIDSDFESESQTEGQASSSDEGDAFSPLMEHFEKLATPVAHGMLSNPRSEYRKDSDGTASIPTHRASISAKFLSRSQRTRSSASTVTAEEQRRRIEALKARINSTSSNNPTNKTNARSISILQHQKSVDSSTPSSSRGQAKEVITANLKKKKLISKSCQNLSFSQADAVFDDWQNLQLSNRILTSPSAQTVRDVIYDPRRSSTPLQKHPPTKEAKFIRRSSSSAWTSRATIVSPVGSPVNEFQRNIINKGSPVLNQRLNDTYSKTNDVILRKSTGNKNRNQRPRSMIIDSKEIRQQLLNLEPFQPPESHSDSESNVDYPPVDAVSQSPICNDNQSNVVMSPIRKVTRDIDIGDCFSIRNDNSSHDNQPHQRLLEQVGEVASEINSSVQNLTLQVLQHDVENNNGSISDHIEIEAGSSKRLIRLYENGLPTNEDNLNNLDKVTNQTCEKQTEGTDEEADETPTTISNHALTWEKCQNIMRNLVHSYDAAAQLQSQILNENPTEEHKKLLSTISRTYAAIENSMHEQRRKLDQIIELRSDETNSLYIQSDLFQELQKTLTVTTLPGREGVTAEIFTILDKYSNVLVDMISSKINGKETLIE